MKKKRPFILLELMIAFALVSISILPFLRYPFQQMKKEIDSLFSIQLEKAAEEELIAMQLLLYENLIPEKYLFAKEKLHHHPLFVDDKVTLTLPGSRMKRTYVKKTFVYFDKQKLKQDGTFTSLVTINVHFHDPKDMRKTVKKALTQVVAQKKNWVHVEG